MVRVLSACRTSVTPQKQHISHERTTHATPLNRLSPWSPSYLSQMCVVLVRVACVPYVSHTIHSWRDCPAFACHRTLRQSSTNAFSYGTGVHLELHKCCAPANALASGIYSVAAFYKSAGHVQYVPWVCMPACLFSAFRNFPTSLCVASRESSLRSGYMMMTCILRTSRARTLSPFVGGGEAALC